MTPELPLDLGSKPESPNPAEVSSRLKWGIILFDEAGHPQVSEDARKILLQTGNPEVPAPILQIARAALSSANRLSEHDLEIPTSTGTPLSLHISAATFSQGKAQGVVLALQDVSGCLNLDEYFWRMDRLATLGTLAAGAAHEIRNALVAGRTFMDLLLEKNRESELATIVRREIERIDGIVNRMLKFAAPGKAKAAPLHLHQVLDHVLRLLAPQLEAKAIGVRREFSAGTDLLLADKAELEQAFINLILNGIEAMRKSGQLELVTRLVPETGPLTLREGAGRACLEIVLGDNGVGIAKENLDRLFVPFFTTKPGGTGLGLVITRRIIEDHSGSVSVESEPGKGTRFTIRLPVLPA